MLTLADVIEALTGQSLATAGQVITDAVVDSRQAIPGSLFVALPGERQDGHEFIGHAFGRGASFALVQQPVPEPFTTVDLRAGIEAGAVAGIEPPVCLRVEDCLVALQTLGGFWRSKLDVRVIGITGSVGKTTTKEVVAEVLNSRFRTLKNPGNLNNEIGLAADACSG